jgi:hypothetical protein
VSSTLLQNVVKLAEASNSGLVVSNNALIIECIELLREEHARQRRGASVSITGSWDLLWTTEKETLFFKRNGLLGRQCLAIQQTIGASDITNTIRFEGDSKFEVTGAIDQQGVRTNFKFVSAKLEYPPWINLGIPPVGQGWFDTVYVDNFYRVSADVRGDYLVCRRSQ